MSNVTLGGAPLLPAHQISQGYTKFISIAAVFTTLSTVCVVLRFLSRKVNKSIGWDDWTSLGALVFAYGNLITTVVKGTVGRAGYHFAGFTVEQFEEFLKILLANNLIYNCSILLSKASLLILYRRIFVIKSFRIAVWIYLSVVVAYWAACEFTLIFACTPIEAQWKFWLSHTGISSKVFWLAAGIINMILDFGILCLPQIRVWQLHLSTGRKILLSLVFLMGFFTCITSIVRIVYLENIDWTDPTYTITNAGIWTVIETDMSIICGCAPTFPGLFRHWYDSGKFSKFGLGSRGPKASRFSSQTSDKTSESNNQSNYNDVTTATSSQKDLTTSTVHEIKGSVCVVTDVEVVSVDRDHSGKISNPHYGW